MVKGKTLAMQLCSAVMKCHCKTCIFLCPTLVGFCQVKKKKSEKNSVRPHPPTPIQVFTFFGNIWKHEYNTKKHKKTRNFQQKKSELRLDPPTHFRVFIGFLDFFALTKPPNITVDSWIRSIPF